METLKFLVVKLIIKEFNPPPPFIPQETTTPLEQPNKMLDFELFTVNKLTQRNL